MRLASNLSRTFAAGAPPLSPGEPSETYPAFYGLSKPPFDATDERRFFMLFNTRRPAFERLVSHLLTGSALVLLLGEDGSGKSAMLDAAAHVAAQVGLRIRRPDWPAVRRIDEAELLAAIGGRTADQGDGAGDRVSDVSGTATRVLLAGDAERLTPAAWAVARRLSREPLNRLSIVVTMNPASEFFAEPDSPRILIPALNAAEVRQYIERSLWRAGGTTRRLITPDALRMIVSAANGRPGTVNRLMEDVFTAGFVRGDAKITARTVAAVLPSRRRPPHRRWTDGVLPPVFAVGLLLIGLSAFLYKGLSGGDGEPAGRRALERAAVAGDAQAATEAGETYDPSFGANPADAAQAAAWYRKAIALGDPRAGVLLRRLLGPTMGEADGLH